MGAEIVGVPPGAVYYRMSGSATFCNEVAVPLITDVDAARVAAGLGDDPKGFSFEPGRQYAGADAGPTMSVDVEPYYVAVTVLVAAEVGKWLLKKALDETVGNAVKAAIHRIKALGPGLFRRANLRYYADPANRYQHVPVELRLQTWFEASRVLVTAVVYVDEQTELGAMPAVLERAEAVAADAAARDGLRDCEIRFDCRRGVLDEKPGIHPLRADGGGGPLTGSR